MSFITKKALPRRTFLRGVGVTVGLPLLEAMVPAMTATAQTVAKPVRRFGAIYVPHGSLLPEWTPKTTGPGYEMTQILKPLEPFRDQMVVLSGLAYVMYYLIFGWIAYAMFTKQYYPEAENIARSLGLRLWLIELARGILMTLAVLPAIYALRMRRWPAAIAIGALLWIVGGAAPLLVPNALMVPTQRYIHIVEILTQNAALGITAVLLLRPARRSSIASKMTAAG